MKNLSEILDTSKYVIKHKLSGEIIFRGESLVEADLREADLTEAYLRGADLRYANLSGANLRDANLRYANLREANLRDAVLYGSDLSRADLREANLSGANLEGADLYKANLFGANLKGANLKGADITDCDYVYSFSLGRHFGFMHLSDKYAEDGTYVRIGCKGGSLSHWLENYKKTGTSEGYTKSEIFNYRDQLKLLAKIKNRGEK